jgi:hypothetical protein
MRNRLVSRRLKGDPMRARTAGGGSRSTGRVSCGRDHRYGAGEQVSTPSPPAAEAPLAPTDPLQESAAAMEARGLLLALPSSEGASRLLSPTTALLRRELGLPLQMGFVHWFRPLPRPLNTSPGGAEDVWELCRGLRVVPALRRTAVALRRASFLWRNSRTPSSR